MTLTSKTIQLQNLTLGPQAGQKIIAPIVAEQFAAVFTQAQAIVTAQADMIEWRLDFLNQLTDSEQLVDAARQLRTIAGKTPIIATNRTSKEGSDRKYTDHDYLASYQALMEAELIDAVDIEFSQSDAIYTQLSNLAKEHGIATILSHHDFIQTPDKNDLIFLFAQMSKKNPSIVKVAVTPQSREDVMALMDATLAADHQISQPIIAMSMGQLGRISRLAGDTFGSIATFGTVGAASAPGQASVADIQATLTVLHAK